MPIDDFLETLVDEVNGMIRTAFIGGTQDGRMVLGGVSGPDGGSGIPPAGFIGKLNQRYVTYDTTEAASTATSGNPSLVDNLNHIRYDVLVLENEVASGVSFSTFTGLLDTPTLYSGGAGGIPFINYNEDGILFSGEHAGIHTDQLKLGPDRDDDFRVTKKTSSAGVAPTLYVETPVSSAQHGKIIIRDGENDDFPAGVTLDNHTYAEIDDDSTVPFTVGTYNNRILVVGVVLRGGRTVSTLEYNSTSLTSAGSQQPSSDVRVEIWYLLDPPSGPHNIDITCSTADDHLLFASSYYNVSSVGTFVSNGGGPTTTASQSLTGTYDAAVSVLALQSSNGNRNATTGDELDVYNYDSIAGGHSWMRIPDESSAAWSFNNDYFALGALHLNAQVDGNPLVIDDIIEIDSNEIYIHKDVTISGILEVLENILGVPRQTIFTIAGQLEVTSNPLRVYNKFGFTQTISGIFLSVDTVPSGSAIIVDVNKDGTTIFTTQGNRPQIAAGVNTGSSYTIDVDSWADGEYLTVDVDQVGSTQAGEDLTVHVIHK